MDLTLLRHYRKATALFPLEETVITITRRSWWSGLIISSAWAREWADAYRSR